MPPQASAVSPHARINAAKAMILAYNDKDWNRVRASVTPDVVYDEVPTGQKAEGVDAFIAACQGWAQAFPDAKGTFTNTLVCADSVMFELTWTGTHRGQLQTPEGLLAPTGKSMNVRACMIIELAGERTKSQRHYFDLATLLGQLGVK
jgi:steroid delta-isomerase-like uncharacterized protein